MKSNINLIVLMVACLMTGCANTNQSAKHNDQTNQPAAQVKLLWADLDTFTDINSGTQAKGNFRKLLIREFEKHFISLAAKLPKGYRFYVLINDIDLAGQVNSYYWKGHEAIRVYNTWFDPEIIITYRVKNAMGEFVAAQDQLKLKNTHNGRYPANRFMVKSFAYEKYLIKSWFKYGLLPYLQESNKS